MSEKTPEEEILELVRLVDSNFKFTHYDFFFRGGNAVPSASFIALLVLIGVYMLIAPLHERLVVGLAFLAFTIGFFSLMTRFGEEHIAEVNFKRFGICVEGDKKPLLKALIKMKARHQEIDLEQIYNLNKSMFIKEKLLEKLYE